MENAKLKALENKINDLSGREINFQNKLLNELSVEKVLTIAEEFALEWQHLIRTEHLDQSQREIQEITSFFQQALHLRNLFVEAQSLFLNVTLHHIEAKEKDLGFNLLTEPELAELTKELINPKQNIVDAITLLSNDQVADKLCLNYNEMNLHTKLIELG
jgi:hypothetical protein